MARLRLGAERVFGDDSPVVHDAVEQRSVLGWVDDVQAGADHRYRPASRPERGIVCHAVYAARQPADDGDAGLR